MERLNPNNVNTPDHMDGVWGGPRVNDMLPCERVSNLLRLLVRGKVLDVGCGNGSYFPDMEGCDLYGVEFAPEVAQRTREKYPWAKIETRDFVQEKLATIYGEQFDWVFCGDVLEHMERPQELLDDIHRVLKPGGRLLLDTPVWKNSACEEHLWAFDDLDLYAMLAGYSNPVVYRYYYIRSHDWDHFICLAAK